MKIGDYVRFKDGDIGKISFISEHKKIGKIIMVEDCYINFKEGDIFKSSPIILDILEPMDLLYIDISPDDCGGIVVPRIPETLDELERFIEKIKSGEYILKYVVTHEQLENNMYEVGE